MADVYVDIDATDDTGAGTFGDPFKYIRTHINSLSAGEKMLVRGDTGGTPKVHTETDTVDITVNGTSGNEITIQPYLTEEVELRVSGSVTLMDVTGDYIIIDGFEFNKQDNRRPCLDMDGDNGQLINCELYDADWDYIIGVTGNNNLIDNCIIHDGINTVGPGCHGVHPRGACGTLTISNCDIYDNLADCIQTQEAGSGSMVVVVDTCNLYITAALQGTAENAFDHKYGDLTIRNCTIWGWRDTSTSLGVFGNSHRNSTTLLVEDCTVYDCTAGIRTASSAVVTIQNNVLYGFSNSTTDPGSGAIVYAAIVSYGSSVTTAENNTFYNFPEAIIGTDGSANLTLTNNIFENCGTVEELSSTAVTASYNCWYNCTHTISGTGDVTTDPLLTDPGSAVFTLQKGSPCIDAGIDVSLPYNGSAPDMGAFESDYSVGSMFMFKNLGGVLIK